MQSRRVRAVCLAVAVGLLGIALAEFVTLLAKAIAQGLTLGVDFHNYLGYAQQWLAGHGFYAMRQLHGPYGVLPSDTLYPPIALWLFVPFALAPAALGLLWWAVPLGVMAYAIWRLRPTPWTWPLLALAVAWPRTPELIIYGNSTMWAGAGVAAGLLWSWPAVSLLLKPTLVPLALVGIKNRSWWLALGVLVLLSLPFGTLWLDYLRAAVDAQGKGGFAYSLKDWPFLALPLIAWCGTRAIPRQLAAEFPVVMRRHGWWLRRVVDVATD